MLRWTRKPPRVVAENQAPFDFYAIGTRRHYMLATNGYLDTCTLEDGQCTGLYAYGTVAALKREARLWDSLSDSQIRARLSNGVRNVHHREYFSADARRPCDNAVDHRGHQEGRLRRPARPVRRRADRRLGLAVAAVIVANLADGDPVWHVVRLDHELVGLVKQLPSFARRWQHEDKSWRVATPYANRLAYEMDALGYFVTGLGPDPESRKQQRNGDMYCSSREVGSCRVWPEPNSRRLH